LPAGRVRLAGRRLHGGLELRATAPTIRIRDDHAGYLREWKKRRKASEQNPYEYVGEKMQWRRFVDTLRREKVGSFGRYFVEVFAPKQRWGRMGTINNRRSVKQFLAWRKGPITLSSIDEPMIQGFKQHLIDDRKQKPYVASQSAARIRRIVNHWQPGRLPTRNARTLPRTKAGTVENFAAGKFLEGKGRRGGNRSGRSQRQKTTEIISRLYQFNGNRGIPFSKFTPELCERFLKWCIEQGVNSDRVNTTYRFELVAISRDATAAGLMKRRLHLDPIAPLKRRPRASTNGRAAAVPAKTSKKPRGNQIDYPEAILWALDNSPVSGEPRSIRAEMLKSIPENRLPPVKGRRFAAFVSRAKRGDLPSREKAEAALRARK
jgi:hypothetical protein